MSKTETAAVSERAEKFAEALASQQAVMNDGCRILKHISKRFESVRSAYEPVRLQSLDLTTSQSNSDGLKDVVSVLLDHLKAADKLKQLLQADTSVESSLSMFLKQLEKAEAATRFFLQSPSLVVATEAISELKQATAHAYHKCGQMIVRSLRQNTRAPTKPDLARILQSTPKARPNAQAMYVSSSAMLATVRRLINVMLRAEELDCITVYCTHRHEHLVTMMRVMGHQIEVTPNAAGTAPSDRRVDECDPPWHAAQQSHRNDDSEEACKISSCTDWVQSMHLLAQLVAWENELATELFPSPYHRQALLRSVKGVFDTIVTQGLEFGRSKGPPERVFQVLQMITCLRAQNVAPLFAKVLVGAELKPLADKLTFLMDRLHSEGTALTAAFRDAVTNDATPLPLKDITVATSVAPQTAFAMRFLKAPDEPSPLQNIFKEDVAPNLTFLQSPRDFALKTIQDLQTNLESKVAPMVKDRSVAAIIMLNNVNYVRVCIEEHGYLPTLLGDSWSNAQLQIIKRWKTEYISRSWEPLGHSVQAAIQDASPQMRKETLKDHFRKINARIEKIQEQSLWSMHDATLRTHVREHIVKAFMPIYSNFWEAYSNTALIKNPAKYFKYSPADFQEFIMSELFSAKAMRKQASASQVPKGLKKLAIEMNTP